MHIWCKSNVARELHLQNGISPLSLIINRYFLRDLILNSHIGKVPTFHSRMTVWRSAISASSSLASHSTPICPREIVGSGTPMLGSIKNAMTNLTRRRVTPFFACISATTCVSEPESFQRDEQRACDCRPGRIYGNEVSTTRVRERKEKWRLRSLSFTWPKLGYLGGSRGSRGTFLFLRVAAQGAPPPGLPHGE